MTMAIYLYFLAGSFLFVLLSLGLGHIEGASSGHLGHTGGHTGGHLTAGHASADAGGHVIAAGTVLSG